MAVAFLLLVAALFLLILLVTIPLFAMRHEVPWK